MNQSLNVSETQTIKPELNVNEILDDLLYRSSKPNPNREILVATSVSHKSCNNSNRSQSRQRHPALLLPASTAITGISHTALSPLRNNNNNNNNSVAVVVSGRQKSSQYWNQYPSESEFDTTRIDSYLNALNLSRRHRSQKSSTKQNVKHVRSRSVDTTLSRLRMSIHKPVNSFFNAITSPSGAKQFVSSSNSSQSAANSSKSQTTRNALVTRSESLNSEGSSISGESGCCEFNSAISHPAKSVLKKTTAANTVQLGPGKKNVTFSAFATIQVMEG